MPSKLATSCAGGVALAVGYLYLVKKYPELEQIRMNLPPPKPISVEVHYESHCSDCVDFFKNQLKPAYDLLGPSVIDLKLVPFGKAMIDDSKFTCQHGQKECNANRLFACVDELDTGNKKKTIDTVLCLMDTNNSTDKCLSKENIDKKAVQSCAQSDRSLKFMRQYQDLIKQRTGDKLDYIPKIFIEGKTSSEIQKLAENKFRWTVCSAYLQKNYITSTNETPEGCSDYW